MTPPTVSVDVSPGSGFGHPSVGIDYAIMWVRDHASESPELVALLGRLPHIRWGAADTRLRLTLDEREALARAVVLAVETATGTDRANLDLANLRLRTAPPWSG